MSVHEKMLNIRLHLHLANRGMFWGDLRCRLRIGNQIFSFFFLQISYRKQQRGSRGESGVLGGRERRTVTSK